MTPGFSKDIRCHVCPYWYKEGQWEYYEGGSEVDLGC